MEDVVYNHYQFNIRLMKVLGFWPYESKFASYTRVLMANIVCFSFMYVQLAAVSVHKDEIDITLTLQTVGFSTTLFVNTMKYNIFCKNDTEVRYIMETVKNNWNSIKEEGIEILEKRVNIGKQQSRTFAFIIFPGALVMILARIASYIVFKMAPPETNMTDPFPMLTEYFIDQKKYLDWIVLHQLSMIVVLAIMLVSTETIYIMWLQHATSLFELASYYFEKGITGRPPTTSTKAVNVYRHECFANAVKYQNEGYDFVGFVRNTFTFAYGILILFSIITLAINIFRVYTALCVTHEMVEFSMAAMITIVQLLYMLYITYVMENVGEYALTLRSVVYNQPWYGTPLPIQKNVLIVLLGTDRSIAFDYYGFYNTTFQNFTVLMKLSVSYFTIMRTFQSNDI